MKGELDRMSKELEEAREELRREYEEKDPPYAFGLFSLLRMWERTGRASLRLAKEQVDLIYDALALDISLVYLPLPFKPPREPYELVLGGDAVLRLMTEEDPSTRLDRLKGVVKRLSIMMLIEEQIRDRHTWPCVVELDGYSLSIVSGALIVQQMEHSPGWPLLELNRATKKIVDDAITYRLSFTSSDAEAQGVVGEEESEMAEGKKDEKARYVDLKVKVEGRATVEGKLRVTKFEEYLVNRRVGISSDEAHKLQGYVDTLRKRGMSAAEAWSLIISVETWAQARKAFWVAIGLGVATLVVAIAGLLANLLR